MRKKLKTRQKYENWQRMAKLLKTSEKLKKQQWLAKMINFGRKASKHRKNSKMTDNRKNWAKVTGKAKNGTKAWKYEKQPKKS